MDQFLLSPHNWDMILRLLLATVLGGAVGIERGSGDRPAGFRTHILVCTGSALIMLVSMYGFDDTYVSGISNANNRDSARIAAQVVSGIGFLGAGTIMHEGVTVRGLTTAAGGRRRNVCNKHCFYGYYAYHVGFVPQLGKAFCQF